MQYLETICCWCQNLFTRHENLQNIQNMKTQVIHFNISINRDLPPSALDAHSVLCLVLTWKTECSFSTCVPVLFVLQKHTNQKKARRRDSYRKDCIRKKNLRSKILNMSKDGDSHFQAMFSPARPKVIFREEKEWLTDIGHNSGWHMKRAQQAVHSPQFRHPRRWPTVKDLIFMVQKVSILAYTTR